MTQGLVSLPGGGEDGVREGDPEAKVGLNYCPGLNRAKFGLL